MKKFAIAGLAGVFLSAPAAHAVTVYALNATNQLSSFDSVSPGTVTVPVTISQGGIVDIDYSPANGRLYGFTATGTGYFINPTTGLATLAVTPTTTLSGISSADFNPGADRVRLFARATDANYRLVPDASGQTAPTATATPGTVLVDGTFSNTAFDLVSSAYSNNFDNVSSTTLYSIDTVGNSLIEHSVGPTFNTVAAVGTGLGFGVGTAVGFDIGQNGVGYVSDGNALYTINLTSGAMTPAGTIGAAALSVTSIAVVAVPEPGTLGVIAAVGLLGLAGRRRRTAR